jgi:uncharacterized protein (DUF58 family)
MSNRRNAIYALLIFCILAGLVTGRTFFYNLAYVLGLLLVGAFLWSWAAVNWLNIRRQTLAQRAQVGRSFDEQFIVTNRGWFPKLWLEVRDQSSLPGHRASHVVPTLLPKRRYRWTVETLCVQRGVFTLGPLTLNSGDPFGLFQFPRHIKAMGKVIVYPATVTVHEFASPIGRLTGGQAVRRRTYEVTTNAAGIRDYAPGDSLNRIHWKTSARRGKLYVKEFELDPLSDVWVFVDFDRTSPVTSYAASNMVQAGGTGNWWQLPSNTEEYVVTCAASICEYYINQDRALGLVAYTPYRELIQPDRGDRQLSRILELLAVARSETAMSLRQMLAIDAGLIGRGNTLVVVTASLDPAWIQQAAILRRRGLYMVAVMVDPSSFGATADFQSAQIQAESAGLLVYPVRLYDNLTNVLSFTPAMQRQGRLQ